MLNEETARESMMRDREWKMRDRDLTVRDCEAWAESIDNRLQKRIRAWLDEDIGTGDVTTLSTVPVEHRSLGIIHAKENGVVAGIPVAALVFYSLDPELSIRAYKQDGDVINKGDILLEVEGRTRAILQGERLALNLLQRMSGIATRTRRFVERLDGLHVKLVDTRKTTPGHRALEKYAVRVGGGANHRYGLYDAVMIKDNHIKAAGGVRKAVQAARSYVPHTMKIEVETERRSEWLEALEAGADIIMLDNLRPEEMRAAVQEIRGRYPHVLIEASGGVTLDTVREIAETGVDVISVGSLTSSVQTLDISLDLNEKKGGRT